MSMRDAIVCGVAKGQVAWRDGRIICGSTFTSVIADHVLAELPSSDQEPVLSTYVFGVLDGEFRMRLKQALRDLVCTISDAGADLPIRAMPDRIAEWAEDLDRINCAIFEFTEAEDVLKALEYITMPGCDWSTFIEEERGNDN